jgi:exopolyphosphatase/guanosine-5'-triphosphate,3'-diphosphate pyrophosphatase
MDLLGDLDSPSAASALFDRQTVSGAQNRIAVIDVGSNSIRLVVYDGLSRCPAYFYNEKVMAGLGEGIHETGMLSPRGRARALRGLRRFAAVVRLMQVGGLCTVATAAVRDARDGPDFVRQVREETGLELQVASGRREAELSAKGVLLGWPRGDGIVCDMGGASMEFARLTNGVIGDCATSGLGPLKLAGLKGERLLDRHITDELTALRRAVPGDVRKLYLVGGSFRAIARIDMERRNYPLKVIHEYRLERESLKETADWLARATPADLKAFPEVSSGRVSLLPLAGRVLHRVVAALEPGSVSVSSYGIREGMLYELMPESLRAKDPLLESARQAEQANARLPGFGEMLFTWLRPLLGDRHPNDFRLYQAACFLHDTTWRAHPDYRAEMCFESVTRANLGGIDHEGRIFLGLAIYHRYANTGTGGFDARLLAMLSEDRAREAEVLGKAMRLGAMLAATSANVLDLTRLERAGTVLTLRLTGTARELNGEAVEKRVASLAQRLGCEPRIVLEA